MKLDSLMPFESELNSRRPVRAYKGRSYVALWPVFAVDFISDLRYNFLDATFLLQI